MLPYLGTISFDLRTRFRRTLEKDLPYCKLKIIFRSKRRLNTLFRFKDPLERNIWSVIIYGYFMVIRAVTARLLIMRKP